MSAATGHFHSLPLCGGIGISTRELVPLIGVFLLRRRIVVFLRDKCRGVDVKDSYPIQDCRPSVVIGNVFGSLGSTRKFFDDAMWLPLLPAGQQIVVEMLKLLVTGRHDAALIPLVNSCYTIPAEEVLRDKYFITLTGFNVDDVVSAISKEALPVPKEGPGAAAVAAAIASESSGGQEPIAIPADDKDDDVAEARKN
jgi:hypothetical protein